jgi:hypothetical protein
VLDRSDRVTAAGRYYFWNPDGPRYHGLPRDLDEARARRLARWRLSPADVGARRELREGLYTEESFYTLDLRRQR